MATIAKPLKHLVRRYMTAGRQALMDHSPSWLRRSLGPSARYLDLMLLDHGIFRLFYLNKHRLGTKAWRSAQPAPHDIARFKRMGIKTIVSLRGGQTSSSFWLEAAACERLGLAFETCVVRSRAAPSLGELRGAKSLFERVEYPILIHCKSGADRAGLVSVLYMHLVEGQPMEEAVKQLSSKYGHFKQAETGVLDHFFNCYIEYNKHTPMAFFDWVENVYSPEEVLSTFRANGVMTRIVNDILRRE